MAVPVLVLAVIAAVTALVGLNESPAWLAWLPPEGATVIAGVLGVLGVWWATPWATRRKAITEREQQALQQLRTHQGRQGHLARIGEPSARALALRVHPAIPLPADHSAATGQPTRRPRWLRLPHGRARGRPGPRGLDGDLPTFVERDKGDEVRTAIRRAGEDGGFIVLVGDSCVGKTRLLYETAAKELQGFAVLAPDLGNGDLVNTIAAEAFPLPKLIIWLDELHRFLPGPYLHDGESAITAATIRKLLQAPIPVVILAAMWPEHASHLRATRPDPTTGQDQPVSPHAVEILTRATTIALQTFSDAERTATAHLAATDPRLAAALGDRTYNITETLAGAPELVHRYERSSQEQQAIIHAAVDARRLGIQAPLSEDLLCATARGYLTTLHPDDTWFPAAVKEISTDDRAQDKATAPLIELLNPERTQILGYTVADYLLQRLTRQRRSTNLPAATWQALTQYPHPYDDLNRLVDSAQRRLLYRYAEPLRRRLADAGHESAAWQLADLLSEQGRTDEAISLLRPLADAGDGWVASRLADLLVERGRTDEALSLLRSLADAGDDSAVLGLAGLLVEQGRTDELRERADAGDRMAACRLACLLVEQGRTDEALSVLRPLADADAGDGDGDGDGEVADALRASVPVRLLLSRGRTDEAISLLRRFVDSGGSWAAGPLADLLVEQGRTDELRERADAGDWFAAYRLADLLVEQGRTDELRERADAGDGSAAYRLAGLLVEQGRTDEAISLLQPVADAGDGSAAEQLAGLLVEQGRTEELRHEVAAGTKAAGQSLISMLTADEETRAEGERLRRFGLNPDGSLADGTAERD